MNNLKENYIFHKQVMDFVGNCFHLIDNLYSDIKSGRMIYRPFIERELEAIRDEVDVLNEQLGVLETNNSTSEDLTLQILYKLQLMVDELHQIENKVEYSVVFQDKALPYGNNLFSYEKTSG